MNTRQLEHVIALADFRNFHRASTEVGITQSALTQSINKLEDFYGIQLFERSKREVRPTAFGSTVIQSAREIVMQMNNLAREIDLMKNLEAGRLVVGCNAWIADSLLSQALAGMLGNFPKLRFSVRGGLFEAVVDQIQSGGMDVFVGVAPERRDDRFVWHDIQLPPLVLICRHQHPVLQLSAPTIMDCMSYPIGSPTLPNWYFDWLVQQLGNPKSPDGRDFYSHFIESDDLTLIRRLILSTDLLFALPSSNAAFDLGNPHIRALPLAEMNFALPAIVCYSAQRPLPPAGQVLVSELLGIAS